MTNAQIVLLMMAALYFLPTLIALLRLKGDTLSILVINLFLGWTLIFWVLMLARSLEPKRRMA